MSNGYSESNIFFAAFNKQIRDIAIKERDIGKFVVVSIIIFNTNFTEQYKDLGKNESYFSYSVMERNTNIKRSRLQKIMNELELEGYICWSYKSKTKHKESILRLNYTHGIGYGKKHSKEYVERYSEKYDGSIYIEHVEGDEDILRNTVNDTRSNTERDTYSKNISKNTSKNISKYEDDEIKDKKINHKILEASKFYLKLNNTSCNERRLLELQNLFGVELLEQAIKESGKRDANSLNYVEKVLNDWKTNKVNTTIEIKEYINKRNNKNNIKKQNYYVNYKSNNSKKLKFDNFKPRDCNYEELEWKLLGWDKD